jgi:hypothetical protein
MTKRNRAKYRRRAYRAGMLGQRPVWPARSSEIDRQLDRPLRDLGGRRAA